MNDEIPTKEDLEVMDMYLFGDCEIKYLKNSFILTCNNENKLFSFDKTFTFFEFLNDINQIERLE